VFRYTCVHKEKVITLIFLHVFFQRHPMQS